MGHIYYGHGPASEPIPVDDRALAHLKIVIVTKLRRGESFIVSWAGRGGRETLWLHPSMPLRFVFREPRAPELDAAWLRSLADAATTNGGIVLPREHAGEALAA